MMANQSFCLKWEGYQTNVTSVFDELRHHDELVDITLCCEGQRIGAHRMLLSACSPYFRDVLKANSCQHMVFYMKDTSASDLRALVEFMYKGSVNVSQNQLASFIRTAEALQIRGLSGEDEQKPSGAAPPRLAPPPPPPQPIVAQKRLAPASVNSVDGASASSPSHLLQQQQHSAHDQAALLSLKQSLLSAAAVAAAAASGGGGNCSPALKRRRHNSGGVITAPSSSSTTSTSSSGVVDLPAATTSTTSSSSSSSSSTSSAVTAAAVVAAAGAGVSEDASVTAVAATTTGGLSEDAAEPSPASSHQSAPSPRTTATDAADDAPAAANDVASRHDGDEQLQDATAAVAAHVSLDDVKVEKVDLTEDSGDDEVDDEMAVATAGDMSSSLETALGQVADYENYDDAGGSALLSSSDFHQQLAMADYSGELGVPGPSHMMTAEDGNSQGFMETIRVQGPMKTFEYHVYNRNVYRLRTTIRGNKYFSCIHPKCGGSLVCSLGGENIGRLQPHNHEDDTSKILDLRVKAACYQLARNSHLKISQIYAKSVEEFPDHHIPYYKLEKAMSNIRTKIKRK